MGSMVDETSCLRAVSASKKRDKIRAIAKKKRRARGVDFYISPTGSVERKVLLDALKDLVV
jgi:hypothetical protein